MQHIFPCLCFSSVLAGIGNGMDCLEKPMSTVKKVSPVEAFRYQGEGKRKKGIRKGYAVMSPNRMMMANLAMNKKRTVGTMFTMGLSCVLFVAKLIIPETWILSMLQGRFALTVSD